MSLTKAEQALAAVRRAQARLLLSKDRRLAFLAALALRLTVEVDSQTETMSTNGERLHIAPDFVLGIGPDELQGVVAHEILHCALQHMGRRGVREFGLWNIACDLAINPVLIDLGFRLPQGVLLPRQFNVPAGLAAEEYYRLLQQTGQGKSKPCPWGKVDATPVGKGDRIGRSWKTAVDQAKGSAPGSMPGTLEAAVRIANRCRVDWRVVLAEYLREFVPVDLGWCPPSRRMLAHGWYLPGPRKEAQGLVAIAVDCSGSVSDKELGLFGAEVMGLMAASNVRVALAYHDVDVQGTATWQPGEPWPSWRPVGRGGTSHKPVMQWANALDRVDLFLGLTDLESDFALEPCFPVLWITPRLRWSQPPYGRVLSLADMS